LALAGRCPGPRPSLREAWFTLETLTATIGRAAIDGTTAKAIAKITRCELIVIDDIGMLPAGQAAGEAFYRLADAAYERRPPRDHRRHQPAARRRHLRKGSDPPDLTHKEIN
jgi:hypothetical protein